MFIGNFENSIDQKGRIIVPAKFRMAEELKDRQKVNFVMGFDTCLYMFSSEGFDKYRREHIDNRPDEDENARALKLFFYSNSIECEMDKQGRVKLPDRFLTYIGAQRELVNIGFGERVEIWAKEGYESVMTSNTMNPKKLISDMKQYVESK